MSKCPRCKSELKHKSGNPRSTRNWRCTQNLLSKVAKSCNWDGANATPSDELTMYQDSLDPNKYAGWY